MVIERLSKKHKTDKEEAQIGLLHGLRNSSFTLCQRKITKLFGKWGINTHDMLYLLNLILKCDNIPVLT